MKLINVTNSHSRLVREQLEHTDAELVKIYTAGDITVIYTMAPTHLEIVLKNNKRAIKANEINEIKHHFLQKIPATTYQDTDISINDTPNLVEISIPISM